MPGKGKWQRQMTTQCEVKRQHCLSIALRLHRKGARQRGTAKANDNTMRSEKAALPEYCLKAAQEGCQAKGNGKGK